MLAQCLQAVLLVSLWRYASAQTVCVRRDVATLAQSQPDQWNIFILALRQIQQASPDSPESYFQLAGIHGEPFQAYVGVTNLADPWTSTQSRTRAGGYCHHRNTLFPTWHRPYLTLIEASLRRAARTIAAQFPDDVRARYQAAAEQLCFPYWDYVGAAAQREGVPAVLNAPTLSVVTPTGPQTVPNPLASYRLQRAVGPAGSSYPRRINQNVPTARRPTSGTNPVTNVQELNNEARAFANNDRVNFYNTFLNPSWACYSNTQRDASCTFPSTEGLHNTAHVVCGGNLGPMSVVPTASFDPIFWLLHCNADRQLAIYQVLQPNIWVTSSRDPVGSWMNRAGATVGVNTPLAPFFTQDPFTTRPPGTNTQPLLYTSNNVRDTRQLGYTYQDLEDNPTPAELDRRMLAQYAPGRTSGFNFAISMEGIDTVPIANAQREQASAQGRRRLLDHDMEERMLHRALRATNTTEARLPPPYSPQPRQNPGPRPFRDLSLTFDDIVPSLAINVFVRNQKGSKIGDDGYAGSIGIFSSGTRVTSQDGQFTSSSSSSSSSSSATAGNDATIFRATVDITQTLRAQGINTNVPFKDPSKGPSSGPAKIPFDLSKDITFSIRSTFGEIRQVPLGQQCVVWFYEERGKAMAEGYDEREGNAGLNLKIYSGKICPEEQKLMAVAGRN